MTKEAAISTVSYKRLSFQVKAHDQNYYRTIERRDTPVENSIDRPRCEQLVPKSLGYENAKNSLQ
jgi:hypothetical protein